MLKKIFDTNDRQKTAVSVASVGVTKRETAELSYRGLHVKANFKEKLDTNRNIEPSWVYEATAGTDWWYQLSADLVSFNRCTITSISHTHKRFDDQTTDS